MKIPLLASETLPGEWCATCSKYVPTEELSDGNCPTCDSHLRDRRAPWHFKLLVFALAVYLTWRFVQAIVWVIHHT